MLIDGTNILTIYGLKLLKLEGYHDLPERKKTTAIDGVAAKDIVFASRRFTVTLKGVYASAAALIAALNGFQTLLKHPLIHEIELPAHAIDVFATAADGFEAKTYLPQKTVVVRMVMTVIE